MQVEAMYYEKLDNEKVRCHLCPHRCLIKEGNNGICRVRVNRGGVLYTLNYGEISSLALDPIEKKPLYHYCPGSLILSAGTFGCNLSCSFCQNYSIAHGQPPTSQAGPEQLVDIAVEARDEGSIGMAFTYNEPSIWYEYVYRCSIKLKEQGLKSILVTNGYIEQQPLKDLMPFIDAMNIDVKAFTNEFYRRNCKAELDKVKTTVEAVVGQVHVEITNLVIPGENDDLQEIKALARWLASLDALIPLHLSRYHPAYKMSLPSTPEQTIYQAHDVAREYLDFVYTGNMSGENNTVCRCCGNTIVKRSGYTVNTGGIENGRCGHCGAEITYIKF